MNKTIILMMFFLAFACEANDQMNEKTILEQKVEAFIFLSDYHHQLHIMIGEEKGDIIKAYNEFKSASVLQTNNELIPVKEALERIKVVDPDLKEFTNTELMCGNSKVKVLKPEWI